MRLLAPATLLFLAAGVVACGSSTNHGDCGPQPDIACTDECGNALAISCSDGEWSCPAVPAFACEECGPLPGGLDCIDSCGNFYSPSCVGSAWTCDDTGTDCPDDPPGKTAEWSESFGSDDYEQVERVAMDAAGNVYLAASFRGTLHLDSSMEMESSGGYDTVVDKRDPAGNVLWRRQLPGDGDELPHGLELLPDGRLVLLLSSSTVNTDNAPKAGPASLWWIDAEDGTPLSSQLVGVTLGSYGVTRLAVAPEDGTILLSGNFGGDLSIGGNTLSAVGESDVYVAALDANGADLWSRSIGGASFDYAVGLDVDGAGNVFLTGAFRAPMTIDGVTLSPQNEFDGFALSLSTTGELRWGTTLASSGNAVVGDVVAYGDGGAAITATFEEQATIGEASYAAAGAHPEVLVARIGPGGDLVFSQTQGAARAGGSLARHRGWHVVVDASGDLLLAGSSYDGSATNVVLSRLDPVDAALRWSQTFGDSNSSSVGDVVTRDGAVALVGDFFGGMDFGNGPLSSSSEGAGFVALFSSEAPPSSL
jgi:hypothetical protein